MSLGAYPQFEQPLAGVRFEATGEVLASNYGLLDVVAKSAKLTPFTAFADNRPIPRGFDGPPEELADRMGEWSEWFASSVGQNAMQALAAHITANPAVARRFEHSDWVVEELEEMSRVLGIAATRGVRFRLQMS